MAPPAPGPDAFDREIRAEMLSGVRIMSALAGVLFPAFLVVDRFALPAAFAELVPMRLGFGAAFLAFFAAVRFAGRRTDLTRAARPLAWALIVLSFFALSGLVPHAAVAKPAGVISGYLLLPLAVVALLPFGPVAMGACLGGLTLASSAAMVVLSEGVMTGMVAEFAAIYGCMVVVGVLMAARNQRLRRAEYESRKRTEQLLLNILPEDIAAELRDRGRVTARNVDDCTILFSDFVGFTALSARVQPAALVASLDEAFHRFDRITAEHGLEKLKTIGDAYMCAGGVMEAHPDHLDRCLRAGLAMMAALEDPDVRDPEGAPWRMRLGLHAGPVVAGVIGAHKFAFDLWGDTVNVAARAESAGRPGGVCMTAETYARVAERYVAEPLGAVELKGKGPTEMVLVTGPR